MPKFEVVSHEFNPEDNTDTFVFSPGNLEALVMVTEVNGKPQVMLGQRGISVSEGRITWSLCSNPAISEIAIEYYNARKEG